MKPIYKSLALAAMTLQVSLALQAKVNDGESVAENAVQASSLDGLKVELVSPNVSGARDLIASGECVIDGANLTISLNAGKWIKGATYSVRVSAVFGTQTVVLYVLNVSVPYYAALSNTPQEYEDEIVVVSTFGDGAGSTITVDPIPTEDSENPVASGGVYSALAGKADAFTADATPTEDSTNPVQSGGVYNALAGKQPVGNYADGSVYQKDGGDSAKITTPLSVGNGVASGSGSIAIGYDADSEPNIKASGNGALALGNPEEGGVIEAKSAASVAIGRLYGGNITAGGVGSVAIGYADSATIQTSNPGSIAVGYAEAGAYGDLKALGQGSQAFGCGTKTQTEGQMVLGKCNVLDTNGDYALIVGNGTADNARSNAFAIDWNGNLVLFNAGTPVVLTPAKLATLIA